MKTNYNIFSKPNILFNVSPLLNVFKPGLRPLHRVPIQLHLKHVMIVPLQ